MNSNSSGALVHLRDSGNTVGWEDDFADTFIMFLSLEPDTFLTLIRLGLLKDVRKDFQVTPENYRLPFTVSDLRSLLISTYMCPFLELS